MSGAETRHRSMGIERIGRGALPTGRSHTERSGGQSGRENAGMSSEIEVRIFKAEYLRFPG